MQERFGSRTIVFGNGSAGERVAVASANPRHYHQLVGAPDDAPPQEVDGLLFRPPGRTGAVPLVIVVPGSLSVAPSHLAHAEAITELGAAAFVLDPFGGRSVTSTVANQAQFSFAASALDVLRAVRTLGARPDVDAERIGLQGHSRGGTAVLLAAMRVLHRHELRDVPPIRAVLAAYPWCGHQPLDPSVGSTEVRVVIGDRDEWCSAQQAQGFVQAIRLTGATASIRIVAGAQHSFDRHEPVHDVPEASVTPGAPTAYIADDGAFVHPVTGVADPDLVDRDLMLYAVRAGYGVRGARIGSEGDQAALFHDDMVAFHRRTLDLAG